MDKILDDLSAIPGVINVHDLHGWTITDGEDLISGHALVTQGTDTCAVLSMIKVIVKDHGFSHPTFQVEFHECGEYGSCYPMLNKSNT